MTDTTNLSPQALRDRSVLVLGLGESGLAMARYLEMVGARVRVVDTRSEPPELATLRQACPDVAFSCEVLDAIDLDGLDLIAWSPGLSNETGGGLALQERAAAQNLPVISELDLFAAALHADNTVRAGHKQEPAQLLLVTGTNGKTTVTELAGLLAESAGRQVMVAGNIGPAMLHAWCEATNVNVDAGDSTETGVDADPGSNATSMPDLWVIEVSSFQLALAARPAADAAVILNISQDHLDWHRDMAAYVSAKHKVLADAAVAISCRDDQQTQAKSNGRLVSFGSDEPTRAGDLGIVHDGGMPWLAMATPAQLPVPGKRPDPDQEVLVKRLMPADALRIRGAHNHLNALAALALCLAVDVPMAAMLHALRDYKGQPHRCEMVGIVNDVEYYNDSKGTNVGATVAALNGLGKRCWLIAGGTGKDQDFSALVDAVRINANGVLLIGQDATQLEAALADAGVPLVHCESLADAVREASERARTGQAVLMSPACASFDMFDNYRHRGNVFNELVRELSLQAGCSTEVS